MPTPKSKRDVILKTSMKTSTKVILACGLTVALVAAIYLYAPSLILANPAADPTRTAKPTQPSPTAFSISAPPTVEALPACNAPVGESAPACGSVEWSGAGQPEFGCTSDGKSYFTLKILASGAAAAHIFEQAAKGIPIETDPAGACMWSSVEASDQEGYVEALLECSAPAGVTVKITENFGGGTCEIETPCPDGYSLETSKLESEGRFYCIPNGQKTTNEDCGPGTFLDEANQCCSLDPANSTSFSCIDPQITAEGFSCGVESHLSFETLREGITLPTCSQPDRPRPNHSPRPRPGCTPDPTGGGCP